MERNEEEHKLHNRCYRIV